MIEEEAARAARYSDLFGEKQEHSDDLALCPICATIGLVRESHPEVLDHLKAAARELMLAAEALLDAGLAHVEPTEAPGAPDKPAAGSAGTVRSAAGSAGNVRHIDLA